jgi:hypothetical protein
MRKVRQAKKMMVLLNWMLLLPAILGCMAWDGFQKWAEKSRQKRGFHSFVFLRHFWLPFDHRFSSLHCMGVYVTFLG